MRKPKLSFIVLNLLVFLCAFSHLAVADSSYFFDPNLDIAVRQQIEQMNRSYCGDALKEITELSLSGRTINSLVGIEQLVNLKFLDISYNPIRDLEPLSELTNLISLNLRETLVTDLKPISGLHNIRYLNIHSTPVSSIKPLANLTNLETLIMRNVYIGTETEIFDNMTKLQRLNVRNTGLTDTAFLGRLMAKGALQNVRHLGIQAEIDLRDNPLFVQSDYDDYAPIREFWKNIFRRQPTRLPDIPTQSIVINEVMASNGSTIRDRYRDNPDWIELYNPGIEQFDLSGYYLSDDFDNLFKWEFPAGTAISGRGFLLIFASGKDQVTAGEIHTNFSISSEGESLLLTAPDGTLVDYFPPIKQQRDISFGRMPNGYHEMVFFSEPTPGIANVGEGKYLGMVLPPDFSQVHGFYQEPFHLALSSEDPSVTIYYTLDGSVPTKDSLLYEEPILIGPENTKSKLLASIKTTGPFDLNRIELDYTGKIQKQAFMPWEPQDVFQGIVVRAVAYKEGYAASDVVTHSYFVDENIFHRYTLPIISISTDPANFFDNRIGIYVAGVHYRNFRPGRPWHNPGNYTQRGINWERPVHVEFFEPGGVFGFSLNMGARIHGGITRSWPQKTLRLYARSSYQAPGMIEYPLFPGLTANGTGKPLEKFKRILLRNAGNHWSVDYMADALMHELISHTRVDVQAYRPAVIFINGEYWGIQNIRERLDQHYLATNYELDPENVVITTHYDELDYGNPGDERDLHEIVAFVQKNNMTSQNNYDYIKTKIDIDNYVDYQVAQIFYSNTDWPGKNTAVWRYKTSKYEPDAPYGLDGRWRWMVYDTDFGFGYAHGTSGDFNCLQHATGKRGPLLRNLLNNPSFRNQFINTFADHLNTSFNIQRIITRIDEMESVLEPEMAEHIQRWGNPGKSVEEWKANVNNMRIWARNRPYHVRNHIIEYFRLSGTANVSLSSNMEEGYIRINSIDIVPETPGIDHPNSWSGIYFMGIPIEITATPRPGYEFVRWEGSVNDTAPTIQVTLTEDITLRAVYQKVK